MKSRVVHNLGRRCWPTAVSKSVDRSVPRGGRAVLILAPCLCQCWGMTHMMPTHSEAAGTVFELVRLVTVREGKLLEKDHLAEQARTIKP